MIKKEIVKNYLIVKLEKENASESIHSHMNINE